MSKHPLADCDNCPLNESRKFCPSAIPVVGAKIAIVGESPAVQDVRSGHAFTGPAARLLDNVLKHHNIDRSEVLFTNATLCRAEDGKAPQGAIKACRPRLIHELQEAGVETVIALGNGAAMATLGRDKVTQLRVGPGKESSFLPGMRVIPSINPALCFRQGDQFPNLVADIGKVKYVAQHFDLPKYVVSGGVDHALELLEAIAERLEELQGPVVVDIEVDVEKDTAFDHPDQYDMLCVGLCYEPGKAVVISESDMADGRVRDRLGDLLRHSRVIAQNGKFDLAGLYPLLGNLTLWFDTMLASYTFDERPGIHGLKYMAVEYLGAPQYDDEIKAYVTSKTGYGAIPRDLLYKYNATDVVCTYALWEMFERRFAEEGNAELRRVHDFLVAASNELMHIELNGFSVDLEYLAGLGRDYQEQLLDIEGRINGLVTRDYDKAGGINPRSPMQVTNALRDWNIRVDTTAVDTLSLLLEKLPEDSPAAPFIRELLHHRKEAKAYGTYVKGIDKRLYKGKVHSSYLLHGTTTGRLSSRNPNMQNIPRDKKLRAMFVVSEPDNVLLQTDYSQAELRVMSFLAQDTYFRDIFNDGKIDVFDDLTPRLYPHADKSEMSAAEWKELRIRVKAYVYGLSYGREPGSIAAEYNLPMKEARDGMNRFFEVIPEIVAFREETRQKVRDCEDLVTPWGRHRRFHLLTKENMSAIMNEALAYLPQSTASDMCLAALVQVRQKTEGIATLRNTIHDAIVLECHKDNVPVVREIVEREMLASAKLIVGDYVKFAVETTVGKSWGEL